MRKSEGKYTSFQFIVTCLVCTDFELLADILFVLEFLLEFCRCGPNAADLNQCLLMGDGGGGRSSFGRAAALADVLLKDLYQFVLVLDHVSAQLL